MHAHLCESKFQVEQRLMTLDETDVEQADRIVNRQLEMKFGNKMSRDRRYELVGEVTGGWAEGEVIRAERGLVMLRVRWRGRSRWMTLMCPT